MIARFLAETDTFRFACQTTGDCCRTYTIYCTPYDIVRLRHATGLPTTQMLDTGLYEIIDESVGAVFGGDTISGVLALFGAPAPDVLPLARLRRPCPFLRDDNLCGVYEHRPGVCRSYPLGRVRTPDGPRWFEREYGCPGKDRGTQIVADWIVESGLDAYTAGNDRFAAFADAVRTAGIRFAALPPHDQAALRAALYDFDRTDALAGLDDGAVLEQIDAAARAWLEQAAAWAPRP